MRRKLLSLVIIVFISVQLTGCHRQENVQSPLKLTLQQKIEDFNTLRDVMNELYPYWEEVKDMGKDPDAIAQEYLERVKKTKSDTEFMNTILDYLDELDAYSLGHLTPILPEGYEYMVELYSSMSDRQSWKNVLNYSISKEMYALFDEGENFRFVPKAQKVKENDKGQESELQEEEEFEENNLSMEVIENGMIGYIKIPSFDSLKVNEEVPKIKAFMKEHSKVAHFIIDIRGNGGGSEIYWMDAFVAPRIQEPQYGSNYYLYNESTLENEWSKPFIKEIFSNLYTEKKRIGELPSFKNLSQYANQFDYFTYSTTEVLPKYEPECYKGKLWVLMDQSNVSAAAGFINFCKQNQFATLVGEADGGDNCNGDPFLFNLPNCGMIIRFDLFYSLNADGTCNGVSGCHPDIECASEEALEVCIEAIKKEK